MSGSYACMMINWLSAAILRRFVEIDSCAVKVGFGKMNRSSNSSTILSTNTLYKANFQKWNWESASTLFRCIWRPAHLGLDGSTSTPAPNSTAHHHTRPDKHYRRLSHDAIFSQWSLPLLWPVQGQDSAVLGFVARDIFTHHQCMMKSNLQMDVLYARHSASSSPR